jgi:UDP-2-acetamido-2-deoxy-ribo-hexuluronate aminotransferase
MRPIQMVDTKSQYLRIKNEVDSSVLSVLDSAQYIGGAVVNQFAEQLANYQGSTFVIPCANGTDALQIALMALGLKAGDEVITPSFTYIATVEVAALLGIKPVFVDVDPLSFCMDPETIESAITPNTKAIVPVHLYGQAADMEKIMTIAEKHGLFVVEDNAQAIGNRYSFSDGTVKMTGSIGHIGCTSFYPSKNLGAFGDGGAISTNDPALAQKLTMIASHGQSRRYYHDVVGCNSRLDAIQAAILSVKLKHLDEYIDARRKSADIYDKGFENCLSLRTPPRFSNNKHVFHQYTLVLNEGNRDDLQNYLSGQGIPSMIYYPVPAHRQQMFASFNSDLQILPQTDWLTERVISLPMHTELDYEMQLFIIDHVLAYFKK